MAQVIRGSDVEAEKEPLNDIGPLDDIAHEEKERHRHKHIIDHDRVGLVDEQVENSVLQRMGHPVRRCIGVVTKPNAHGNQRETYWKPKQNRGHERPHHYHRNLRICHFGPSSCPATS
jgi:hypothetical protein